jgi:hypothetical protein
VWNWSALGLPLMQKKKKKIPFVVESITWRQKLVDNNG